MKLAGVNSKGGGGRAMSVRNVLSGDGIGSITLWGGDLGLVIGDVPEVGVGACGIPKADNGTEGTVSEGRDLDMYGTIEVP